MGVSLVKYIVQNPKRVLSLGVFLFLLIFLISGFHTQQAYARTPVVITEFDAQIENDTVLLSWNLAEESPRIIEYEYSDDAGVTWEPIQESSDTTTSHTVSNLTFGDTYAFQVRAITPGGAEPASDKITIILFGLQIDAIAINQAQLSWTQATSSDVTGYQYRQDDGRWVTIPNATQSTNTYTLPGLIPGVPHTLAVRAILEGGETTKPNSIAVVGGKLGGNISDVTLSTSDELGNSVAVSPDGNTLFIGAEGGDSTDLKGSVYLFTKDTDNLWTYNAKITEGTNGLTLAASARFGSALTISADGNTLFVGARSGGGSQKGGVHIFSKSTDGSWAHSTKIDGFNIIRESTINQTYTYPGFGSALAISPDGNTLFVGVPYLSYQPGGFGLGGVFILTKENNTWEFSSSLISGVGGITLSEYNSFGSALAISPDGNTLFVGAESEDSHGSNRDAVYVLKKNQNNSWRKTGVIKNGTNGLTLTRRDEFGSAIAISPNGETLYVGARYRHNDNGGKTGSVYVFTEFKNDWLFTAEIGNGADGLALAELDRFGTALAVSPDNDTVFIGADEDDIVGNNTGAVYMLNARTDHIDLSADIDYYRTAILSWDAADIPNVTGYEYSDDDGVTWQVIPGSDSTTVRYEVGTLTAGNTYNFRVRTVTTSGEDKLISNKVTVVSLNLLISAVSANQAVLSWTQPNAQNITGYQYQQGDNQWVTVPNSDRDTVAHTITDLVPGNWYAVAIRALLSDGSVSEPDKGMVTAGKLTNETNGILLNQDSTFGSSAAISPDGETLFIGAMGDVSDSGITGGAVHIFTKDARNFWMYQKKITAENTDSLTLVNSDQFGSSIAISSDGNTLFVGASGDNTGGTDRGAMYIFIGGGDGSWTYSAKLADGSNGISLGDDYQFGSSAAISPDDNTLFIGVIGDSVTGGTMNGAVYTFEKDSTGSWTYQNKINHDSGGILLESNSQFGSSVAISPDGSTLFVGSRLDSAKEGEHGVVYVFTKPNSVWTYSSKITDRGGSLPGENDYFGSALALSSDGDTLFIGSQFDNTGGEKRGAIYVFSNLLGDWVYSAKIADGVNNLELANNDQFGASIVVTPDNKTLIVGADKDDPGETNTGAIYTFSSPNTHVNLSTATGHDTVTLSWDLAEENAEVIGYEYTNDNGSTWIPIPSSENQATKYTVTGLTLGSTYTFRMRAITSAGPGPASNGVSVTLLGLQVSTIDTNRVQLSWTRPDTVSVTGYQYRQDSGQWKTISQAGRDTITHTVTSLIPGAPYAFTIRAVVSENETIESNAVLTVAGKLIDEMNGISLERYSQFGSSVAVSPDGNTLFIGAFWEAAVHIFTKDSDNFWIQQTKIADSTNGTNGLTLTKYDQFGAALALSSDGNTLFVGSVDGRINGDDQGAVHIFTKGTDGSWTHNTKIKNGTHGLSLYGDGDFGSALALSPDGNTLLVGTPNDSKEKGWVGAVYTFSKNTSGSWEYQAKMTDGTNGLTLSKEDQFGSSIAFSSDGNTLFISAEKFVFDTYNGYDEGAVHILTKQENAWSHTAKIAHGVNGLNLTGFFEFGSAIALSSNDNTLFVGSNYSSARGSGAVHVFTKNARKAWIRNTVIKNNTNGLSLSKGDMFGYALALSPDNTRLFVGARSDRDGGWAKGSVYMFDTRLITTAARRKKRGISSSSSQTPPIQQLPPRQRPSPGSFSGSSGNTASTPNAS